MRINSHPTVARLSLFGCLNMFSLFGPRAMVIANEIQVLGSRESCCSIRGCLFRLAHHPTEKIRIDSCRYRYFLFPTSLSE